MKEFIKKHYLLVTNILCFILGAMNFASHFVYELCFVILYVLYFIFMENIVIAICFLSFIIAMNVIAFNSVKKDEGAAVILALFGGIIGAFISAHTANKDYRYKKVLNLLFNIFVWIFIWAFVSIIAHDYYGYP